jgi:ApaG protein
MDVNSNEVAHFNLLVLAKRCRVRQNRCRFGTVDDGAIPVEPDLFDSQSDIFQGIRMAAYELTVTVRTQYLDEQSEPDRSIYVFAYAITITNSGQIPAQLISRHWVITDANNHIEEVRGLGVVGHQPLLEPGQVFEYTSGATLPTPQGSMRGAYFCVAEDGEQFQANIPEFVLSRPRTLH